MCLPCCVTIASHSCEAVLNMYAFDRVLVNDARRMMMQQLASEHVQDCDDGMEFDYPCHTMHLVETMKMEQW